MASKARHLRRPSAASRRHRTNVGIIRRGLKKCTEYEVTSIGRGKPRCLKLWRLKLLIRIYWISPTIHDETVGAWWIKGPNDLIDRL